jgi:pyridoxamine 5'-phosphate oxidase
MTLATATADGRPSARLVSLKRLTGEGLVFTTALWTRKAAELRENPAAAATFFWPQVGRQVRVEGRAEIAERALAEELFAERPRSHQLQAHVSRQGEEIEGLDRLRARLEALEAELGEGPVPCPEDWGAVQLRPDRVEFWQEGEDRLHNRTLYESSGHGWRQSLLAP